MTEQIEFTVAEIREIANSAAPDARRMLLEGIDRVKALVEECRKDGKVTGKDVPAAFLKLLLELTGAERGVIGERTGCNQLLGGAVLPRSSQFGITRIVLQSVLRDGKYLFCNNAYGDPRFATSRSIMREKTGSIIAVPLSIEGQLVGYIYIDAMDHAGAFRPVHLCLVAYAGDKLAHVMPEHNAAAQSEHSSVAPGPLDPKTEQQLILDAKTQSGFFRGNKREKRIQAIAELGRRRSPGGLAEILTQLGDKDALVAAACATALTEYGMFATPKENAEQFCDRIFSEASVDNYPHLKAIADVLKRSGDENMLLRNELMQRLNSNAGSERLRAALGPVKEHFEQKIAIRSGETDASLPIDSRPKIPLMELDRQQRHEQAREAWIRSGRKGPDPTSQF